MSDQAEPEQKDWNLPAVVQKVMIQATNAVADYRMMRRHRPDVRARKLALQQLVQSLDDLGAAVDEYYQAEPEDLWER